MERTAHKSALADACRLWADERMFRTAVQTVHEHGYMCAGYVLWLHVACDHGVPKPGQEVKLVVQKRTAERCPAVRGRVLGSAPGCGVRPPFARARMAPCKLTIHMGMFQFDAFMSWCVCANVCNGSSPGCA
ncbi:hypothetical protein HPP92_006301 [Vanilla planifolia]|uniref:Uncharacterized protein n=1 Tax=Vanilla planifolia TaxID=51239 RepID=A0A835VE02_VANPL|nr:hypothetical protein HPP92_006301 [Vanilla planifolia]